MRFTDDGELVSGYGPDEDALLASMAEFSHEHAQNAYGELMRQIMARFYSGMRANTTGGLRTPVKSVTCVPMVKMWLSMDPPRHSFVTYARDARLVAHRRVDQTVMHADQTDETDIPVQLFLLPGEVAWSDVTMMMNAAPLATTVVRNHVNWARTEQMAGGVHPRPSAPSVHANKAPTAPRKKNTNTKAPPTADQNSADMSSSYSDFDLLDGVDPTPEGGLDSRPWSPRAVPRTPGTDWTLDSPGSQRFDRSGADPDLNLDGSGLVQPVPMPSSDDDQAGLFDDMAQPAAASPPSAAAWGQQQQQQEAARKQREMESQLQEALDIIRMREAEVKKMQRDAQDNALEQRKAKEAREAMAEDHRQQQARMAEKLEAATAAAAQAVQAAALARSEANRESAERSRIVGHADGIAAATAELKQRLEESRAEQRRAREEADMARREAEKATQDVVRMQEDAATARAEASASRQPVLDMGHVNRMVRIRLPYDTLMRMKGVPLADQNAMFDAFMEKTLGGRQLTESMANALTSLRHVRYRFFTGTAKILEKAIGLDAYKVPISTFKTALGDWAEKNPITGDGIPFKSIPDMIDEWKLSHPAPRRAARASAPRAAGASAPRAAAADVYDEEEDAKKPDAAARARLREWFTEKALNSLPPVLTPEEREKRARDLIRTMMRPFKSGYFNANPAHVEDVMKSVDEVGVAQYPTDLSSTRGIITRLHNELVKMLSSDVELDGETERDRAKRMAQALDPAPDKVTLITARDEARSLQTKVTEWKAKFAHQKKIDERGKTRVQRSDQITDRMDPDELSTLDNKINRIMRTDTVNGREVQVPRYGDGVETGHMNMAYWDDFFDREDAVYDNTREYEKTVTSAATPKLRGEVYDLFAALAKGVVSSLPSEVKWALGQTDYVRRYALDKLTNLKRSVETELTDADVTDAESFRKSIIAYKRLRDRLLPDPDDLRKRLRAILDHSFTGRAEKNIKKRGTDAPPLEDSVFLAVTKYIDTLGNNLGTELDEHALEGGVDAKLKVYFASANERKLAAGKRAELRAIHLKITHRLNKEHRPQKPEKPTIEGYDRQLYIEKKRAYEADKKKYDDMITAKVDYAMVDYSDKSKSHELDLLITVQQNRYNTIKEEQDKNEPPRVKTARKRKAGARKKKGAVDADISPEKLRELYDEAMEELFKKYPRLALNQDEIDAFFPPRKVHSLVMLKLAAKNESGPTQMWTAVRDQNKYIEKPFPILPADGVLVPADAHKTVMTYARIVDELARVKLIDDLHALKVHMSDESDKRLEEIKSELLPYYMPYITEVDGVQVPFKSKDAIRDEVNQMRRELYIYRCVAINMKFSPKLRHKPKQTDGYVTTKDVEANAEAVIAIESALGAFRKMIGTFLKAAGTTLLELMGFDIVHTKIRDLKDEWTNQLRDANPSVEAIEQVIKQFTKLTTDADKWRRDMNSVPLATVPVVKDRVPLATLPVVMAKVKMEDPDDTDSDEEGGFSLEEEADEDEEMENAAAREVRQSVKGVRHVISLITDDEATEDDEASSSSSEEEEEEKGDAASSSSSEDEDEEMPYAAAAAAAPRQYSVRPSASAYPAAASAPHPSGYAPMDISDDEEQKVSSRPPKRDDRTETRDDETEEDEEKEVARPKKRKSAPATPADAFLDRVSVPSKAKTRAEGMQGDILSKAKRELKNEIKKLPGSIAPGTPGYYTDEFFNKSRTQSEYSELLKWINERKDPNYQEGGPETRSSKRLKLNGSVRDAMNARARAKAAEAKRLASVPYVCARRGCKNPGVFVCEKCLNYDNGMSTWCSQACKRASAAEHTAICRK